MSCNLMFLISNPQTWSGYRIQHIYVRKKKKTLFFFFLLSFNWNLEFSCILSVVSQYHNYLYSILWLLQIRWIIIVVGHCHLEIMVFIRLLMGSTAKISINTSEVNPYIYICLNSWKIFKLGGCIGLIKE